MSDIKCSFKQTSRLGVFVICLEVPGGEPFTDEVSLLTVDGREAAARKVLERFPGLDREDLDQLLANEAARVFRAQDLDAVARAAERAKERGLLTFMVTEAYRRAVVDVRGERVPVQDAARALATIPDATEDDVVRLFPGHEESVRSAFREGDGDASAFQPAPAMGAGILFDGVDGAIPVSWEVSSKRSAETGTIRTPRFTDRLSIQNASRRRGAAKQLAVRHGLEPSKDTLGRLEDVLMQVAQVDADSRCEVASGSDDSKDADLIVKMMEQLGVELFHTPGALDSEAYATVPLKGHHEVWSIEAQGLKRWIGYSFYQKYGRSTSDTSFQTARNTLAGMALFDGPEHEVFVRRGFLKNRLYIDLANERGEAVEIDADGYRIVDPIVRGVHFIRKSGMLPLPTPVDGGSVDELRSVLNVRDDSDWTFVKGFMLSAYHPTGPYLGLAPNGEKDSGKSWFSKIVRRTVDPSDRDLRRPITNEPDLAIAASSSLIVAVDNLSKLSDNMSDAYCSLNTGASISKRKLYTDNDEVSLFFKRPTILNGISYVAVRADLADRVPSIRLSSIPKKERLSERVLKQRFEEMHARVFGALCNAVSAALRGQDHAEVEIQERMLDILEWVTPAEVELGIEPGGFGRAYSMKVADSAREAFEDSAVAIEVQAFMEGQRELGVRSWTGTCKDLLAAIKPSFEEDGPPPGWPKSPQGMRDQLRRASPLLRREGVVVTEPGPKDRPRLYRLELADDEPTIPDDAPQPASSAETGPDGAAKGVSDDPDDPDDAGGLFGGGDAARAASPASGKESGPSRVGGSPNPESTASEGPEAGSRRVPLRTQKPRPEIVGIVGIVGTGPDDPEKADSDPTIEEGASSGSTVASSGAIDGEEIETWEF